MTWRRIETIGLCAAAGFALAGLSLLAFGTAVPGWFGAAAAGIVITRRRQGK